MKSIILAAAVFLVCAGSTLGMDLHGTLLDKACSLKAAKEGQKFAEAHDTKCALSAESQKSGYGVFTASGAFFAFDEGGNAKALVVLKATKKTDNLQVTVMGDIAGNTVKVAHIALD